jgi:hypothetical protein
MSGIEVVAAVSAIISAFHGGSELLKHVKAKRRRVRQARQSQQELEEKQLEDSLESGEQQIGFRWAQDEREFGDLIRVGDGKLHPVRSPLLRTNVRLSPQSERATNSNTSRS